MITANLVADYDMSLVSGTLVPDSSGAANHGTVVNGPLDTDLLGSRFNGINQTFLIPTVNMQCIQIYGEFFLENGLGSQRPLLTADTPGNNSLQLSTYNDTRGTVLAPYIYNSDGVHIGSRSAGRRSVISVNFDSSPQIYINYDQSSYYVTQIDASSYTVDSFIFGAGGGNFFKGRIIRILIYDAVKSESDLRSNVTELLEIKKGLYSQDAVYRYARRPLLVCKGDSITRSFNVTHSWTELINPTNVNYDILNFGIDGYAMIREAEAFGSISQLRSESLNVVSLFLSTNDYGLGETAADTFEKYAKYSKELRKRGSRVIAWPMLSRGLGADSWKAQFNDLLLSNYPMFDSIVSVPTMTADGAYSNTSLFQGDEIHPNDGGQAVLATGFDTEINKIKL